MNGGGRGCSRGGAARDDDGGRLQRARRGAREGVSATTAWRGSDLYCDSEWRDLLPPIKWRTCTVAAVIVAEVHAAGIAADYQSLRSLRPGRLEDGGGARLNAMEVVEADVF